MLSALLGSPCYADPAGSFPYQTGFASVAVELSIPPGTGRSLKLTKSPPWTRGRSGRSLGIWVSWYILRISRLINSLIPAANPYCTDVISSDDALHLYVKAFLFLERLRAGWGLIKLNQCLCWSPCGYKYRSGYTYQEAGWGVREEAPTWRWAWEGEWTLAGRQGKAGPEGVGLCSGRASF